MRAFILDVTKNKGALFQPGSPAQCQQVWHQVKVTVTQLPVGKFVTGHRLHFHINRQQVVTAVGSLPHDLFQKEFGVKTLAHDPADMIGKADDNRFNFIFGDELLQLFRRQHPSNHHFLLHLDQ